MIHQGLRRTFLRLAATASVAAAMLPCLIAAGQPAGAVGRSKDVELKLMGHRFLTFSTLVRVRQIETSRERLMVLMNRVIHTPAGARYFGRPWKSAGPGRE